MTATLNTIHEDFNLIAANFADKKAISTSSKQLTYREIKAIANQCERAIRQYAIDASPIMVSLKDDIRLYALFLGIMQSGRAYFYIDPDDAPLIKKNLADKIGSTLIIGENIKTNPTLIHLSLESVLAINDVSQSYKENTIVDVTAACCLVRTSGTTQQARALAISHHTLRHNISNFQKSLNVTFKDRLSLIASPQFSAATPNLYGALLSGACLFPFSIKANGLIEFHAWLQHEEITILHFTPSLFRLLAKYMPENSLPQLRAIKLGGETVYPADVTLFKTKFAKHCVLINGLGMSEVGGNVTHFIIRHDTTLAPELNIVPVGKVLPGHEVTIIDNDNNPITTGMSGQIKIRSEYLSNGYWHEENSTYKNELYSQDNGYFLPDGLLVHIGRNNNLIKRNGFRIDLNLIESTLLNIKTINNVAVYFKPLGGDAEILIACIQLLEKDSEDATSIQTMLERILPSYMLPQKIIFLDNFPLTSSGKIDSQEVLTILTEMQIQTHWVKPRNALEQKIIQLWQAILGRNDFGVYDNFFELGADSLRSMEFIAYLMHDYQISYALSSLATYQTIAEIAEHIDYQSKSSPVAKETEFEFKISLLPIVNIEINKTSPPLVFIPGGAMSEKELLLMVGTLRYLSPKRAVAGMRANLLKNTVQLPESIENIATIMTAAIQQYYKNNLPILIGECVAGVLTLEVARQLEKQTGNFPSVILLNPWHPHALTEEAIPTTPLAHYYQLLRAHIPSFYAGNVNLIFAKDQSRSLVDFQNWWTNKTKTLSINNVPGDGNSYIRNQRDYLSQTINTICHSLFPL